MQEENKERQTDSLKEPIQDLGQLADEFFPQGTENSARRDQSLDKLSLVNELQNQGMLPSAIALQPQSKVALRQTRDPTETTIANQDGPGSISDQNAKQKSYGGYVPGSYSKNKIVSEQEAKTSAEEMKRLNSNDESDERDGSADVDQMNHEVSMRNLLEGQDFVSQGTEGQGAANEAARAALMDGDAQRQSIKLSKDESHGGGLGADNILKHIEHEEVLGELQGRLRRQMDERQSERTQTISQLAAALGDNKELPDRNDVQWEIIDNMVAKNEGFFNGIKVPFYKNSDFKQCIANPHIDGGYIGVQYVVNPRKLKGNDKLSRKFVQDSSTAYSFKIDNLQQKNLNINETDRKLLNYGEIVQNPASQLVEHDEYALISFFNKASQEAAKPMKPIVVPYTASRPVNKEQMLEEVVFLGENGTLFLFSQDHASKRLLLNIIRQGSSDARGSRAQSRQGQAFGDHKTSDMGAVTPRALQTRIEKHEIGSGSRLELQVRDYLANGSDNASVGHVQPMRAPTMVTFEQEEYLCVQQAYDPSIRPAIYFYKVPVLSSGNFPGNDFGQSPIKIDGAEMFIKMDAGNVYYVTNKKFTNPASTETDLSWARLSSPTLVKAVSFTRMREASEGKIKLEQEAQTTWQLDGQSSDVQFYRCYANDFPYVRVTLHADHKKITFLLSCRSDMSDKAITLDMRNEEEIAKSVMKRQATSTATSTFIMGTPETIKGEVYLKQEMVKVQVQASVLYTTHGDHKLQSQAKRIKDEQVFGMRLEKAVTSWEIATYPNFSQSDLFNFRDVVSSPTAGIQFSKMKVKQQRGKVLLTSKGSSDKRPENADEYPEEYFFDIEAEPYPHAMGDQRIDLKGVRGFLRETPFDSHIIAEFSFTKGEDPTVLKQEVVFERKVQATLVLEETLSLDEKDLVENYGGSMLQRNQIDDTSFQVTIFNGSVKDSSGLVNLQSTNITDSTSSILSNAILIAQQDKNTFVLNGVIHDSVKAVQNGAKEDATLSLTRVSNKSTNQHPRRVTLDSDVPEFVVPAFDCAEQLLRGGQFNEQRGLISQLEVESELRMKLVSFGFDHHGDQPYLSVASGSLYVKDDDVERELRDDVQELHSTIRQTWTADYPIIAYKSFAPNNREICLYNLAIKKEPIQYLHLGKWRFICFVEHANMDPLSGELNDQKSHILFMARQDGTGNLKIFMAKMNPWKSMQKKETSRKKTFGSVSVLATVPFKLDPVYDDSIMKADLLLMKLENEPVHMGLVIQYTDSIKAVSLTVANVQISLVPPKARMLERQTVRHQDSDNALYFVTLEQGDDVVSRVSMDREELGNFYVQEIFRISTSNVAAIEYDPQRSDHVYLLDDEQRLYHLYDDGKGKCSLEDTVDLHHHKLEEKLRNFMQQPWAHVLINARSISIGNRAYSLKTGFRWSIDAGKDTTDREKAYGNRDVQLMREWPFKGTLRSVQLWKANELYFFRVRPLPNQTVIPLMGMSRQLGGIEYWLAGENTVIVEVKKKRVHTFNKEGFLIEREFWNKQSYPTGSQILLQSPGFQGNKFFLVECGGRTKKTWKIVHDRDDQPPKLITQFDRIKLLEHLKFLFESNQSVLGSFLDQFRSPFMSRMNDDDLSEVTEQMQSSLKIHKAQSILTNTGQLLLFASTVITKHAVIDEQSCLLGNMDESQTLQFRYTNSSRAVGVFSVGNVRVLIVLCNSEVQRSKLIRKQKTADEQGPGQSRVNVSANEHMDASHANNLDPDLMVGLQFKFSIVDEKLVWANLGDRQVYSADLSDLSRSFNQVKFTSNQVMTNQEQQGIVTWSRLPCKSFGIKRIFGDLNQEQFETGYFQLASLEEHSVLRRKKIPEKHDGDMTFVQVTANRTAAVINLAPHQPHLVGLEQDLHELQRPIDVLLTGYVNRENSKSLPQNYPFKRVWTNSEGTIGLLKPFDRKRVNGINVAYSEIDYRRIRHLAELCASSKDGLVTKEKVGVVEPETMGSLYEGHTFFSIFRDRPEIYTACFDLIREQTSMREKQLMSDAQFKQFQRTLKYLVTLPVPVPGSTRYMSMLQQCFFFKNKMALINLYKVADQLDLSLTDYVSSVHDLMHVLPNLQAKYGKQILNKFESNQFLAEIQEQLINRKQTIVTYKLNTPIVGAQDSAFDTEMVEGASTKQLARVKAKALPLHWITQDDEGMRNLFKLFKQERAKFEGSLVQETIFDAFWRDFRLKIAVACFVPYLVYFSTSFWYIVSMLDREAEKTAMAPRNQALQGSRQQEFIFTTVFALLWLYFAVMEFFQILGARKALYSGYFSEFSNWIDLSAYLCNFFIILYKYEYIALGGEQGVQETIVLRRLGSVAALLLVLQLMFWLRLFEQTAHYISLIRRTILQIKSFMIVMAFILLGFGSVNYMLQMNRLLLGRKGEELVYAHENGENLFYNAILNQYFIMLGDFGGMALNDEDSKAEEALVTLCFILTTFISQITILNMLIAIMSEAYDDHKEERQASWIRERLSLITEYDVPVRFWCDMVPGLCRRKRESSLTEYVVVLQRDDEEMEEDDEEGEDQMALIKRTLEQRYKAIESLINKKMVKSVQSLSQTVRDRLATIEREQIAVKAQTTALDAKFDALADKIDQLLVKRR